MRLCVLQLDRQWRRRRRRGPIRTSRVCRRTGATCRSRPLSAIRRCRWDQRLLMGLMILGHAKTLQHAGSGLSRTSRRRMEWPHTTRFMKWNAAASPRSKPCPLPCRSSDALYARYAVCTSCGIHQNWGFAGPTKSVLLHRNTLRRCGTTFSWCSRTSWTGTISSPRPTSETPSLPTSTPSAVGCAPSLQPTLRHPTMACVFCCQTAFSTSERSLTRFKCGKTWRCVGRQCTVRQFP